MARLKKGDWSTKEVEELLKITKSNNSTKQLNELAQKWKRDPQNLRAKWGYENSKRAGEEDWETPMEFEVQNYKIVRRNDSSEVVRMKKGLDVVIPTMKMDGRSFPIPTRLAGTAKRYMEEMWPTKSFGFSEEREKGKPTGNSRVYRKK